MGKSLHIIKENVRNVVDEEQFRRLYAPNGWKIDESFEEKPVDTNLQYLKTETELKNYNRAKNIKRK